MWILSKILTVLFPPQCLFCKKENVSLCMECIYACSKAVETPHKWIYTTYSYKNASIKKCMQLIKYYHRKDLIEPIVKSTLNHSLFDFIKNKENSILVPIPSPVRRVLMRGYNHAELLAQAYSKELNIPLTSNLLLRDHYTPQQAKTRDKSDRKKNISHAFSINPLSHFITSKHIILIDDTTTTGLTLAEAKKTLEQFGFNHIQAITIAH